MSTFRTIRKKETLDTMSTNPPPDSDHRKRRRNRTTQSCLNCHTSKRMCDRKRPCGRCTQLGLTGLCIYEVDDPSQRSDTQDESSRLRQRVAELEGVIRELKNKPHPRWVKSGSSLTEEFEKCHARARSRSTSEESVTGSQHQSDLSHPSTTSGVDSKEASPEKKSLCLANETLQADCLSSLFLPPPMASSAPLSTLPYSPFVDIHSPPSAPSTCIVTPTEEHPQMQITVAGGLTNDVDLSSLFMPYPDLLACDEGTGHVDHTLWDSVHRQYIDPHSTKYHHAQILDGHCGCLHEAASYNVILELSLRLRKAADILSHCANHRFSNCCPLNQRIVDLDAFAATALGNITTSPNNFGPVHLRSWANTAPTGPIPPAFSPSSCIPPIHAPGISPSFRSLRFWNGTPSITDLSGSCDESLMTWEPSRRV